MKVMLDRETPLEERFWARVDKGDGSGCWLWTAYRDEDGYGIFNPSHNLHPLKAHRIAYELLVGPIPEGLELDHLCHTRDRSCSGGPTCPHRACCNPADLEPVTTEENQRRRYLN